MKASLVLDPTSDTTPDASTAAATPRKRAAPRQRASTTGATETPSDAARGAEAASQGFTTEILDIGGQQIRVGRRVAAAPRADALPLLMFNGIGGNIELLEPLCKVVSDRDVLTFDIPGVGQSPLPRLPYRLPGIASTAAQVLDHYGYDRCDALGVSWGGAAAQQFAFSQTKRCRRLILCATAAGVVMVPGRLSVLTKMATPQRYMNKAYSESIAGHIYGGDFRTDATLVGTLLKHVKWHSKRGYYLQLLAVAGWTSAPWLPLLKQPTLVMAGSDDPLVPMANAHLLKALIRQSRLQVFDCGHLFLLTRLETAGQSIRDFLNEDDGAQAS